ncbi:MAG: hypothetical protein QXN89_04140 [Candidatus Woesearchaeota archaeon]
MKGKQEEFHQQFTRRVEETEEKPFEGSEKGTELPEELHQYQQEGQRMVDSYKRFFTTFAKDVSLDFKMSNGFYIDLENGVVHLDTKWFAEKGFSVEQILWATLHELSHFRDLAQDPERMMRNFEYIREQAKRTGAIIMQKWEQKYGATDPEFIERLKKQRPISKKDPSKTMNAIEQAAYKIHHTFYNIFDDVYVNNLVARCAPRFEQEEAGGEEVKKLYREKLFVRTNYSNLPRHLQFLYKLLWEEMVPDQEAVVNDEVAEVMRQKTKFQGREYTPKEIVEQFIKPRAGRDTKAGQRYFVLQNTLEPVFIELLMKDLEDWEPQKSEEQKGEGEPQEGGGNPFEQDYEEFDKNSPDQIRDQDIYDWMNKYQEDKKKEAERKKKETEEESKSAEEKAKEAQEKIDKEWCRKHNLDYETVRRYRQIEQDVAPYLEDLSRLWRKIIFGSSRRIERDLEGYFKTGIELDIGKVIEEWPKIEKGQLEEVRVMKKITQKEVLIRKPELIRVRVVGDMSDSMDRAKRYVLQQCFVLLLSSLREFNTYLNLTRSETKSKLEVDTEAWIFGDSAQKVKRLRNEAGMDDEQVETIKIFERLQNTIGGTYDNKALEAILNSITPEDREKIGREKIMEMVFEITDGGSSAPEAAKRAVDMLEEAGIIARAFQIGAATQEEKDTFNNVWNKGRKEKLGEVVGEEIENLLPAITELLKKYLTNVKL